MRKRYARPKLSRSWKKHRTLSRAQHYGFVGACVCHLRPESKALKIPTQLETKAKKKAFPIIQSALI
jgi:hypothetical protein